MKPFELTRKAKGDLYAIALYSEQQWGKAQRNLYIKQLDDAFHVIAENPALGKNCDALLPGYRKFPQGSHVIYYLSGNNPRDYHHPHSAQEHGCGTQGDWGLRPI